MTLNIDDIDKLAWKKMDGLLPVIVQNGNSAQLLMQGYMNEEALRHTLRSGKVTFFSRSKNRLWMKGEISGHTLDLIEANADCDNDAILILAKPNGPTCHTGAKSCWFNSSLPDYSFLSELEQLITARKSDGDETSYTASLYQQGIKRIAQKVGEEGVETALAAATGDIDELKNEAADLLYHLMVLLHASDCSMADVIDVLRKRHADTNA
ncbi:bifunctional phosphoribosyl-AMP cyclohydrolase/phosphoribosyl-ATP diphosphatase HisIE [Alteromonas sp. ASW11-130]|uniref:bifunctional phosphoribosyl-AMP cyclohydrolase/phosphoribosyl-ATP diphosphatase HisIE n=1 Tax=Alteromonas sp. ASW11-130 TaxID=3015775 RepID=UPI0022418A76|nr:bifunctional phosphoribosyl-AMP cyclohydrolase/phosphoribosyl-ATP diphosphatase HisIE [Alteromonas sp. ASW11-130]MCW8092520.1 bifunctional phosphoribosyl-AMP cyclohydrolase/phosphoribosyl-ATP diphosphatase HisIE [Alteromonas sp. ASW11-130]